MTNFKKKFTTAIATGAVLANAFVPMAFAQSTTLQITGNGAFSDNKVDADLSNEVTVNQSNDADIDNNVDVDADTGNNSASFNTGGDSRVRSGDATVDVNVLNAANKNIAEVNGCCVANTTVNITDNGAYSENKVDLDAENEVKVDQDNDADIDNDIDIDAKTGGNTTSFNTNGNSSVRSGDANVDVTLSNVANANSAKIGGGSNGAGNISALISGNGAFSDNKIDLDLENEHKIDQDNDAILTMMLMLMPILATTVQASTQVVTMTLFQVMLMLLLKLTI